MEPKPVPVHCIYSDDGKVNGENYRKYALIKLNGEIDEKDSSAHSQFYMKRTEDFKGWDAWKEENKKGRKKISFEIKDMFEVCNKSPCLEFLNPYSSLCPTPTLAPF